MYCVQTVARPKHTLQSPQERGAGATSKTYWQVVMWCVKNGLIMCRKNSGKKEQINGKNNLDGKIRFQTRSAQALDFVPN